jgi:hypothetical protein
MTRSSFWAFRLREEDQLNVDYGGLKTPYISADQIMVQQALYII